MIKSRFFFKKIRSEKLYKNCKKKSLLACSDDFSKFKMKDLHDRASFQDNKKVWKTIFVLHISRIEKMITFWFFFGKMHHRKLYTSCVNKSLLQNKNRFPNFFFMLNTLGSSTIMYVLHSEYGKTIRASQKGFLFAIFVQLFRAHLFKKKLKILSFLQAVIYTK